MDEFLEAIVVAILTVLCAFGAVHLLSDVRHFDEVVKQCKEQGYIQNDKVRVMCSLEKNT